MADNWSKLTSAGATRLSALMGVNKHELNKSHVPFLRHFVDAPLVNE